MSLRLNKLIPYIFVAPNVLVVLIFAIYPLISNFFVSFTIGPEGTPTFVGFDNYITMAEDKAFWTAAKNTFYYSALLVIPTVILSLILAIGLNRNIPFRNTLRAVYLLPHLLSWAVIGLIWRWMYSSNNGILNSILTDLGLPTSRWILDPDLTIPSLALTGIWAGVGYYMIIYLAGLQGISGTYYEAAKIDGANRWQQFWYITLPALKPITVLIINLSVISSFRVFEQVYVMTGGGPGRASFVLVLYIYIKGLQENSMGYAAALSVVLFGVLILLTLLLNRLIKDND
jgi:multiple sugar transport system permease protein